MANTNAEARYGITAEDRSKAAREAVLRGFKDVDKGIRSTLRGLNVAMGLFLGVQMKQMFNRLIRNAEEADEGFARAMGNVRDSFKELMTPKGGMVEATEKMEELSEVLRDPALIAAVDSLTSAMITGFANAGIGLAALIHQARILLGMGGGNAAVDLDAEILQLQQQRASLAQGLALLRNAPADVRAPSERQLAALDAQIAEMTKRYWQIVEGPQPDRTPMLGRKDSEMLNDWAAELFVENTQNLMRSSTDGMKAAMDDVDAEVKRGVEAINASIMGIGVSEDGKAWYEKWNDETKTAVEKQEEMITDFALKLQALMSAGLIDEDTAIKRMDAFKESFKNATDEMSEYWKEAHREMQSAAAEFLFDPAEEGLDGLLKNFIDTIRRIIAEWGAAKIFGPKSSGGLGVGDAIGAFLDGLFGSAGSSTGSTSSTGVYAGDFDFHGGFAKGGSFVVPGSGGIDSRLTMFRATPGEVVSISPRGARGSAVPNITLHSNMIIKDATTDFIRQMPAMLDRRDEALKADLLEGMRIGKY